MKTIKNKIFRFYSDAAHGWMAVKISDLKTVGMRNVDISSYSYTKGKTIYLEEDLDADKFYYHFHKTFGKGPDVKIIHHEGRSPIRNYTRYDYINFTEINDG